MQGKALAQGLASNKCSVSNYCNFLFLAQLSLGSLHPSRGLAQLPDSLSSPCVLIYIPQKAAELNSRVLNFGTVP